MSSDIRVSIRSVPRIALVGLLTLSASTAMAQSIQGTATYRERMALPPAAVFEAALEDVSRADAPAETIARTRVASPGNPPIAFTIAYDPARIVADHRYVVRARILLDDKLLFTTDTGAPVITGGSPTKVSMMLRRVGASQTSPPTPGGTRPLEGTYWKAIELAGKPTPAQDPKREAHLLFQAGGRVSGSDGCNRIAGTTSERRARHIWPDGGNADGVRRFSGRSSGPFRDALKSATRLTITGDRLELFDAAGKRGGGVCCRGSGVLPSTSSGLGRDVVAARQVPGQ